jgi:excisionase family DNA binding protein
LKRKQFDPLEYIEKAFLDKSPGATATKSKAGDGVSITVPSIDEYLQGEGAKARRKSKVSAQKFRKTQLSAPRPRRARQLQRSTPIDPELQEVWETLPKSIEFLFSFYDDKVTSNYYRGEFKESREQLIRRLLDPELTLEETSRLLGVCPATVRRYTNRKWLSHHRTKGGQRRFRLSDVVKFVELHGRFPEE